MPISPLLHVSQGARASPAVIYRSRWNPANTGTVLKSMPNQFSIRQQTGQDDDFTT
jgi:hypothetical protein